MDSIEKKETKTKKIIKAPVKRKTAREYAFLLTFERLITGERNDFSKELAASNLELQAEFFNMALEKIDNNFDFLSNTIQKFSKGFSLERMHKVDLAILILASAEILFLTDLDDLISVNEALELSKRYSSEKSTKFVHGILSSILAEKQTLLKEIRA